MDWDDIQVLRYRIKELEKELEKQTQDFQVKIESANEEMRELRELVDQITEEKSELVKTSSDNWIRRVEWTINNFREKTRDHKKNQAIQSPPFRLGILNKVSFEFFPTGNDNTKVGFCAMFLHCPRGYRLKYQLFVGKHSHPPDDEEWKDKFGKGHSNFCPLAAEVDIETNSLTVGIDVFEITEVENPHPSGEIKLITRPLEAMVSKAMEVMSNRNVSKIVWKITGISKRRRQMPRGTSMSSPLCTAAGVKDIMFEFYPNGTLNTIKEGYCSLYLSCAKGSAVLITLFVGKDRKAPIKAVFNESTGKGLSDFCLLSEQVNEFDDSIQVGVELKNDKCSVVVLES